MRLLHAGHRDEPVRALSSRRRPRRATASTRRSPAISAAAPATSPIVDAALATCDGAPADRFAAGSEARRAALAELDDGRDLFVGDGSAFFAAPASEKSLADLYQRHPDAVLLAGATDVGLWITKQFRDLKKIIWLGRVAGLDAISEDAKA